MLLDWPAQKKELQVELQRAIRQQTLAAAPVVAQVPHVILQEGHKLAFVYPDGSRSEMEPSAHEVSWQVEREDLVRGGGRHVIEAVQKLGGALAKDMETNLLGTLRKASERTGGVFRGETAQDIAEEFLGRLELMDVEFDDDGRPSVVMVLSPQMIEHLSEIDTPELRQRADEVLEKKRREWLSRESRRRLAN